MDSGLMSNTKPEQLAHLHEPDTAGAVNPNFIPSQVKMTGWWQHAYIPQSLFPLGAGANATVYQVTTKQYPNSPENEDGTSINHHLWKKLTACLSKRSHTNSISVPDRYSYVADVLAMKFEHCKQADFNSQKTHEFLFLFREYLIFRELWKCDPEQLIGFPLVFDFDFLDTSEVEIPEANKNCTHFIDMDGSLTLLKQSHGLKAPSKLSYLATELLSFSIKDITEYFAPFYNARRGSSAVGNPSNPYPSFFKASTAFKIADQLLCRLLVLHSRGFVHLDLKPDNVAMGMGQAMNTLYLLDFGYSMRVSDTKLMMTLGSLKYKSHRMKVDAAVDYGMDIESWFYILLTLLYNDLPWTTAKLQATKQVDSPEQLEMVVGIKKKYFWKAPSHFNAMLSNIEKIHQHEVPDIANLMTEIYNKTIVLFEKISKGCTELKRTSDLYKSYMDLRMLMLCIFDFGETKSHFDDNETFKHQVGLRKEKKLPFVPWMNNGMLFEWDEIHRRVVREIFHDWGTPSETDLLDAANDLVAGHNTSILEFQQSIALGPSCWEQHKEDEPKGKRRRIERIVNEMKRRRNSC